jgi:cbb3-type cytochrome oxidase maturation protein
MDGVINGRGGVMPAWGLWSLKSGQYDDLDGAAVRILPDDDIASRDIASRGEL